MSEFKHDFRVRYAETDQMGVGYYANYLVWFEMGRAEYLRWVGLDYNQYEEKGVFLPVIEAHCQYQAPVKYDDLLQIQVAVTEFGRTSMRFEYEIWKVEENKLSATGYTVHAFINRDKRPIRAPEDMKKLICVEQKDAKSA